MSRFWNTLNDILGILDDEEKKPIPHGNTTPFRLRCQGQTACKNRGARICVS